MIDKNVRNVIYYSFFIFFLISSIFTSTIILSNAEMSIEMSSYNIDQKNSSIKSKTSVQNVPVSAGEYIESFYLTQIGKIDESGSLRNTFVVGDYAYLADSDFGLRILNIENKSHPIVIGQYKNEGFACEVQVVGNLAYLANGKEGLEIIDISDPTQPEKIGEYKNEGYCAIIRVEGDRAFISSHLFPIKIINISNPKKPIKIGEITETEISDVHFGKFTVSGNFVYVPCGFDGILIFDVTDVSNPDLISQYMGCYYCIYGFDISGNYAYIAGSSVYMTKYIFTLIDISNPANPIRVGGLNGYIAVYDILIKGDFIYCELKDGFNIYNLTNHREVGSYNDNGTYNSIFATENYVYISDFHIGLKIIDVSDPMNPNKIAEFKDGEYFSDFIIEGQYIYLVDSCYGLKIINISDPSNPNIIGGCTLQDGYRAMVIKGNFVYIANGEEGLVVIDISNPTNPKVVAIYTGVEYSRYIEISGNYSFLLDFGKILHILDISEPLNPIKINNYTSSSYLDIIKVYDDIGYLITFRGLIEILNMSDPTNPILICEYQTKEYQYLIDSHSWGIGHHFLLKDHLAYFTSLNNGLEIIDMSNLKNPKHIGQYAKHDSVSDIQIYGNFTWIVDYEGIKILNTSNPCRISIIDEYSMSLFKLKIIGNNIYACSPYEMLIFEYVYQKTINPNWISGMPISWIMIIAGLGIMIQLLKTQNHENFRKNRK